MCSGAQSFFPSLHVNVQERGFDRDGLKCRTPAAATRIFRRKFCCNKTSKRKWSRTCFSPVSFLPCLWQLNSHLQFSYGKKTASLWLLPAGDWKHGRHRSSVLLGWWVCIQPASVPARWWPHSDGHILVTWWKRLFCLWKKECQTSVGISDGFLPGLWFLYCSYRGLRSSLIDLGRVTFLLLSNWGKSFWLAWGYVETGGSVSIA